MTATKTPAANSEWSLKKWRWRRSEISSAIIHQSFCWFTNLDKFNTPSAEWATIIMNLPAPEDLCLQQRGKRHEYVDSDENVRAVSEPELDLRLTNPRNNISTSSTPDISTSNHCVCRQQWLLEAKQGFSTSHYGTVTVIESDANSISWVWYITPQSLDIII